MLLHKDKELFRQAVYSASAELQMPVSVIEKDYYVSMILMKLADRSPTCVFKGGTSLSKCYHVIDRFSEDIDISFSDNMTQGQRKRLKNDIIAGISKEMDMPIPDWDNARSRRDYNCYTFAYEPLEGFVPQSLIQGVKMEVSYGAVSFPVQALSVDSLLYQYLSMENMDIVVEFDLRPFTMHVQSLERTLADKVFALCDYYLSGRLKRHSRHIYDIYMLLPYVVMDDEYKKLVSEIRQARSGMEVCLSAKAGVDIPKLLAKIIDEEVYREDYNSITSYFQKTPIPYDKAISSLKVVLESNAFA